MQMDCITPGIFSIYKSIKFVNLQNCQLSKFCLCDSACLRSHVGDTRILSFKRYELFTIAVHKSKEILLGMVTHVSRVRKPQ